MFKRTVLCLGLIISLVLTACSSQSAPPETEASPTAVSPADLNAVKTYALDHAHQMKTGTADLLTAAQAYYDFLSPYNFDYQAAWQDNSADLARLVADVKTAWLVASQHYELDEGIIAGVPQLADYDVWIDAGPSATEDPDNAYVWTLELPDGRTLDSPGNFFHSLLEPAIWGTNPDFTGLLVDLDSNGTVELGEALPDAALLLGAAQGLDDATQQMIDAVSTWEPTLSDAFTALVVMIPTMNEYFEQWQLSTYVAGNKTEEVAFVGFSRLFDITGILNGLDVTYDNVSVLVAATDADLHAQIVDGFQDLRSYVDDLYTQEQDGVVFTAAEADLFGTAAQEKATALAGQVSQAAALLKVTIEE